MDLDLIAQDLDPVTRRDKGQLLQEDLADRRFVQLIGNQGWDGEPSAPGIGRAQVLSDSAMTPGSPTGMNVRRAAAIGAFASSRIHLGVVMRLGLAAQ